MLGWIGVALLSASWLFGLEYYHRPEFNAWMFLVGAGALMLSTLPVRLLSRRYAILALLLVVPAVVFWPSGLRTPVVMLAVGLAMTQMFAWARLATAARRLAGGLMLSGCVLICQSFALEVYKSFTARTHELPAPLPGLLGAVAGLLGIESGVHDSTVAIFSMREIHMLGATWELFLDPVTFLFLIGGAFVLIWQSRMNDPAGNAWSNLLAGPLKLIGLVAFWLPVRSALMMAIFLQGVLRTEYEESINSVYLFWSGWLHLAMLIIPVLLAWRFCPLFVWNLSDAEDPAIARQLPAATIRRQSLAGALALAALGAMTTAMLWDPVGPRKAGHVVIEEYNPDPEAVWERTDKPFDTQWYGNKSGYTYFCIYDYLHNFYNAARLAQPISDAALQDCDVLVLKTPTRPLYSEHEIENIRRFVDRGGGLLLIGEHTNVFGTGNRLNAVAKQFGFEFVPDCLFGMDSVFTEVLQPGRTAHPSVQLIDRMDFATSCSLKVGSSPGRAAILATGLKNKTAEYHVDNYYPAPSDTAKMRYGAFVQLWTTNYGQGRVMAFTDSTDFSNFCEFDPGKSELMIGMIEWLNHRHLAVDPLHWLIALALVLVCGAYWAARGFSQIGLVLVSAALLGYTTAVWAVAASHHAAMPMPPLLPDRHPTRIVMDRTVSGARLPVNGFMDGRLHGFGIFERWLLRLGYFTARRPAPECFAGDADMVVVAYPRKLVSKSYLQELVQYVERGGLLLVLDSQKNDKSFIEDGDQLSPTDDQLDEPSAREFRAHATTNDLLEPFQMSVDHASALQGELECDQKLPVIATNSAIQVAGGQPFARIGGTPVGAWKTFGRGKVIVIGFGDRLCDQQMGVTGDAEPDAELRKVYECEFSLVRAIIQGDSLNQPNPVASVPATKK